MKGKTFSGGFKFRGFLGQPRDILSKAGLPSKVIIPLAQRFGTSLRPHVRVGDYAKAGQIIARDDESVSSPIHSTINGNITAIDTKNYFNREVTMVTIEGDGSDVVQILEGYSRNWASLSPQKVEDLLYTSGVTSIDRSGIPTRFKSSVIGPADVTDVIIRCTCDDIYNMSPDLLLKGNNIFNFLTGLKILHKVLSNSKFLIALSSDKQNIIDTLKKEASKLDWLFIHPVIPKYPQGYDEILLPTILNKEFPYGYSSANIGVIVLNFQTITHVFEAVTEGRPLIERTIALAGPSFVENLYVKIRIGTPLESLLSDKLKDGKARIVYNSLLNGFTLSNRSLPIDRTFSQIIAIPENDDREFLAFVRPGFRSSSFSYSFLSTFIGAKKSAETNLHGEERPCVQCGYCISVCPAGLMPTLLDRHLKVRVDESLLRYKIFDCIDCNLCSYVCPSKIPLAKNLKVGKEKMLEIGCDQYSCRSPKYDLKGLEDYKGVKVVR